MSETTVAEPLVVEQTETKPGYAGKSVPRKEDKRLVQGQGVFFDDVKRHNMGYVHFVRSPYAHAKIVSIDVSKALERARRLRHADRRRGRDPDRPVLPDLARRRARTSRTTRSPSARRASSASRSPRSSATTRELARDAAELVEVEYEPLPVVTDARDALDRRRAGAARRGRHERELGGRLRVGRHRRGVRRGRPRR